MRNSLLLPVYVPTLILAFGTGMLVPVLPLYARSFQISYGLVGLVLASRGLGNLVGDVPAGILLGKMGQKWSMLVGIAVLAVSMLAMSWARSVVELVLYSFVAGVGMAMWNISRHAYITNATPLQRRGRANSIFGGINRIGSFVGPAVGGALATAYGLRAPFVLYAAVSVVALAISALSAEDNDAIRVESRGGLGGHTRHLAQLLRSHGYILATAGTGQLLAQMIRAGRQTIVPLFASDVLGLDVQAIGWIVTLSAFVDMSMFYPAGYIMDRFGRKYAYVPCFAIQAVGMALIPFATGFWSMLMATLLIGFGNGLGSGTMLTLGADLAPKESMGEFLGIWRLIGDSGQSGAPLVVGGVADLLGLSPATFVIAGVGLAAALVLGLLVPETLQTEKKTPAEVQA
ncbi:MFS transporter [Litorilinea aerophila]|uniref:MFS transporter n=1 Tax=Litorilinea aerophila TaxID=1204385 RepID=A0A540VIS0_9CHLR|nr:MFS transporter [Litorilinea aerophila]MCC9075843.1 MFS transporter [Litorilinea aerophila]